MSAVCFLLAKLSVQLTNADVRIAAVIAAYPVQFFLCMCVGMLAVRPMRLRCKGFPRPVIQLVLAHQGRLGDMIPAQHKVYILCLPVQLYRIYLCGEFVR